MRIGVGPNLSPGFGMHDMGCILEGMGLLTCFDFDFCAGINFQAFRRGRTSYVTLTYNSFVYLKKKWCFTVVLLKSGPYSGRIAVIAEIIDHNRVRNPSI